MNNNTPSLFPRSLLGFGAPMPEPPTSSFGKGVIAAIAGITVAIVCVVAWTAVFDVGGAGAATYRARATADAERWLVNNRWSDASVLSCMATPAADGLISCSVRGVPESETRVVTRTIGCYPTLVVNSQRNCTDQRTVPIVVESP